jgi:hypothetical protein
MAARDWLRREVLIGKGISLSEQIIEKDQD